MFKEYGLKLDETIAPDESENSTGIIKVKLIPPQVQWQADEELKV